MGKKLLKKTEKLFAILLAAVVFISGCKNTGENDQDDSNTESPTPTIVKEGIVTNTFIKESQISETNSQKLNYNLTVSADEASIEKSIQASGLLYGIFLEDINYAVDGGIYGELVKNRSFEYGSLAVNGNKHGFYTTDALNVSFNVCDGTKDNSFLNEYNTHYASIQNKSDSPEGICSNGYLDGMGIENGKEYLFSVYLRTPDNYKGSVAAVIESLDGKTVYAEGIIKNITDKWQKYELTLIPDKLSNKANSSKTEKVRLSLKTEKGNTVYADMISLFPKDTYNGRVNGLRNDIVEYLKALEPKFIRFPGGCVIEGKTLESAYNWKESIGYGREFIINGEKTVGDVAVRQQGIDIWADLSNASANPYYMSYGCGFYEYFLLCEDIGAMAVPILNAGTSCEIQGAVNGHSADILSIDSEEFKQYVQDALDLVEFCRGGEDTKWGLVRIAMGHKEPFKLKYIGIGNEQWSNTYFSHYEEFLKAFNEMAAVNDMYKDIELIVANGPSCDSKEGLRKVKEKGNSYAGLVDEHYYCSPLWFLNNVNRYNSYNRNSVPIFLGEYAAQSNTMQAALAEAAYMTGLEKNSDIVKMACYAPLFGNETAVQWTPDMIWFNKNSVFGSVNYYAQKLFMTNQPDKVLNTTLVKEPSSENAEISGVFKGAVGLGTWETSAEFDNLLVTDNKTGEVLLEEDFNATSVSMQILAGNFKLKDGKLVQTNTSATKNTNSGDTAFIGDMSWSNYTMSVQAVKRSGNEGFIIPVCAKKNGDCIFWNIGGWGNSVSCLQIVSDGIKSGQVEGTVSNFKVSENKTYNLKVVVSGNNIKCYAGNLLIIDYTEEETEPVYETAGIDKNGDTIIKLVNTSENEVNFNILLDGSKLEKTEAVLSYMKADSKAAVNSFDNPEHIVINESTITAEESFSYKAPALSISIIKIKGK